MKKRHYILTAIISYLLLLVATIPAQPITEMINNNSPVKIQGVSGTLWSGKAYLVNANNGVRLKNTRWSIRPGHLLLGSIVVDLDTQFSDKDVSAQLGASMLGRYFINDLSATISAQDVAQLANLPLAQLSGIITLDIESAQWKQGDLPSAIGNIKWNDATVTVADTASLGNISIQLSESDQQMLNAEIKNQGGDIKIAGTAELVPEANYVVDIKLIPTASANNNIRKSLGMFAQRQSNGEYNLKKTGSLDQIM